MAGNNTFNILMYSHDTYGLGHIRRTMAIATQIQQPDTNILIISGSPIVGRFDFPENIDFVRIPGMIKKSNDVYVPHSIKIHPKHALDIRKNIITATARTFKPHVFIVDKVPLGLKREIIPTLKFLKRQTYPVKTILGLRDIMDDAESTKKDWRSKRVYSVLDEYYNEIWVYGDQRLYDPISEYDIPEPISEKVVFTGYIPRQRGGRSTAGEIKPTCRWKTVLVTTGGGGDGYPLMDAYLKMLENWTGDVPFRTVMVTGPFMPKAERENVALRSKLLGVKFLHFNRRMEKLLAAADLVVSMGGYNTICETLSHGKVSLIIPRETPRLEQRIRAEVMSRAGLVDYIPWSDMSPVKLRTKVENLLDNSQDMSEAIDNFEFTGLEVMRSRIARFRAQVL
jgi:predicted glycosyltransferase